MRIHLWSCVVGRKKTALDLAIDRLYVEGFCAVIIALPFVDGSGGPLIMQIQEFPGLNC
jgi:hypothetical protein